MERRLFGFPQRENATYICPWVHILRKKNAALRNWVALSSVDGECESKLDRKLKPAV
jgi:hypothetical protein